MQLQRLFMAAFAASTSFLAANDNFADAEAIVFQGLTISRSGDTNNATVEPGEPLSELALVTLDAIPGETYYISITGEGNTRGNYTLEVSATRNDLVPVLELIPARSNWSSLIHRNASGVPIAPDSTDPDFYTTWQTPSDYNGPAF